MKHILQLAILIGLTAASIVPAQAQTAAQTRDTLKVSILGDSYSTFDGWLKPSWNAVWYYPEGSGRERSDNDVRKVEQTWWHQVIADMGYKLETNNSLRNPVFCTLYKRSTKMLFC